MRGSSIGSIASILSMSLPFDTACDDSTFGAGEPGETTLSWAGRADAFVAKFAP